MFLKTLKGLGISMLFFLLYVTLTLIFSVNVQSYALYSLLSALIFIAIMYFIYNKDLKKQAKNIKKDFKPIYIVFGIIMTILVLILDYFLKIYIGHDAANQDLVIKYLKESPILFSISTIFIVPFAEELIFRYPYKKETKYLGLITSTIVFALIHMSGTSEIIFLIPYLLLSLTVTLSYFKSDNIYISYFIHALNNLINVILLIW